MISLVIAALSLSTQAAPVQQAQAGATCTAASSKGIPCVTAPLGQRIDGRQRAARAERSVCNPDPMKNRACHHDKLMLSASRKVETQARTLAEND